MADGPPLHPVTLVTFVTEALVSKRQAPAAATDSAVANQTLRRNAKLGEPCDPPSTGAVRCSLVPRVKRKRRIRRAERCEEAEQSGFPAHGSPLKVPQAVTSRLIVRRVARLGPQVRHRGVSRLSNVQPYLQLSEVGQDS